MKKEEYLKELIKKKYGSIKSFSEAINIPYTTIRSILERGLGNSSINNVLSITNALGISIEFLEELENEKDIQLTLKDSDPLTKQLISLYSQLTNDYKAKVLTYTKEQLFLQNSINEKQ